MSTHTLCFEQREAVLMNTLVYVLSRNMKISRFFLSENFQVFFLSEIFYIFE